MTKKPIDSALRDQIASYINERASAADDVLDCYWISGDAPGWPHDAGYEWCYECGEAEIELFYEEHPELDVRDDDGEVDLGDRDVRLDGGWGSDHDSVPFCEGCGCRLQGSLTKYGADQELDHFLDQEHYPGRTFPESWALLSLAIQNLLDDKRGGKDRAPACGL